MLMLIAHENVHTREKVRSMHVSIKAGGREREEKMIMHKERERDARGIAIKNVVQCYCCKIGSEDENVKGSEVRGGEY